MILEVLVLTIPPPPTPRLRDKNINHLCLPFIEFPGSTLCSWKTLLVIRISGTLSKSITYTPKGNTYI